MGRYKKGYLGPRIEEIRERCKRDLRYLVTEQLGMKRWSSPFHDDLVTFLNRPGRSKLILMPRGHQKTSIITMGWVIQQMLADPDVTNTICSATWSLSRGVLRDISRYLTETELGLYFGKFKTKDAYWTKEAINIAQKKDAKNPSIFTVGIDSSKTGTHCRNLIFDDIVAPENITTKEQIQKVIEAYKDCLPLLEAGGRKIMIGTRYAIGDIYGHIMEHEMRSLNGHFFLDEADRKEWRKYVWPVAQPNLVPPAKSLGQYDVYLRQALEKDLTGIVRVVFPEAYVRSDAELDTLLAVDESVKMDSLETIKRTNSTWKWSGQYMNDPVDQDTVEFKSSWFRPMTWEQRDRLGKAKTVMSLDPAFRLKQHNDFSGIVVSKTLQDNSVCVLYAEQIKVNPERLVFEVFRLYERYKFDLLVLETAQAQLLMTNLLREEMKRRNVFFVIHEVAPGSTDNKAARIRGLIPAYANGRIYHAPGLTDLEAQLTEFPRNSHDDIIDALSYQIPFWQAPGADYKPPVAQVKEGSFEWWQKRGRRKPQSQLRTLFRDLR